MFILSSLESDNVLHLWQRCKVLTYLQYKATDTTDDIVRQNKKIPRGMEESVPCWKTDETGIFLNLKCVLGA